MSEGSVVEYRSHRLLLVQGEIEVKTIEELKAELLAALTISIDEQDLTAQGQQVVDRLDALIQARVNEAIREQVPPLVRALNDPCSRL